MSTGSAEKDAEVIDEFEEIARETLDRIIGIIENDSSIVDLNDSSSKLITEAEISRLIKEDIELNNPVDLNKSIRLINLEEFEKSPITNNTCTIGLRSNKNIIHSEYIPVKRTVKIKKMASPKITTLKLTEALKIIPQYSGLAETTYPFISACETIIDAVEPDQLPLLLKMIAATKLTGKAYNATRYKEINAWSDLKQIILDAFESPYGAANLQIELNIIKMKPNESVHSYNNRVEEIFQKLCNAVAVGKTSSQTMTLRENIGEQALVSYINGLTGEIKFEVKAKNPTTLEQAMQIALMADKNIRTYNEVQDIFKNNEPPNRPINKNFRTHNETQNMFRNNDQYNNRPYNQNFNHERNNNPPNYNRYNNINNFNNGNTNGNQNTRNNNNLNVRRCFTCNREGHFSSQCRANSRPPNQYNRAQDGLGYVTYAYETCSYCNKRGHMADVCFKKQRDERGNNINSGNGRVSHATRGARAINYVSVDPTEIVSQSYSQQ